MPPDDSILHPRAIARVVLTVLAVVGSLYLIYLLRKPIGYVILATFLAITLSGPVNVLSRYMKRGFAITLTYLGLMLIPVLLGLIVVPPMVTQATNLADKAPQYARDVRDYVNKNKQLRKLDDKYDITGKINDEATKLPSKIGDAAGTLSSIGLGLVNSAFALVQILILSIFLVSNGRRWLDRFVEWRRPREADRIKLVADRVGRTFGNYIGGALLQATIAGIIAYIVMEILGVPFAAPLAVLTFFLDLIPLVGATIAAVVVAVVTVFSDFPTVTIIWVVFAIVYQQVENTLIQPQIQRRAVEVHAFVVLVGVLCGATLFGIIGALLAIPVIASAQITLREWMAYQQELRVTGTPPGDLPSAGSGAGVGSGLPPGPAGPPPDAAPA
jgi:predicted PurR-regulated permease PerM